MPSSKQIFVGFQFSPDFIIFASSGAIACDYCRQTDADFFLVLVSTGVIVLGTQAHASGAGESSSSRCSKTFADRPTQIDNFCLAQ